jgi:hypothetical protein
MVEVLPPASDMHASPDTYIVGSAWGPAVSQRPNESTYSAELERERDGTVWQQQEATCLSVSIAVVRPIDDDELRSTEEAGVHSSSTLHGRRELQSVVFARANIRSLLNKIG